MQLLAAHHLRERLPHILTRERHQRRKPALVLRERHERQIPGPARALESREVRLHERVAQLPRAVRPEIEEHHGVAVRNANRLTPIHDRRRRDELVGDVLRVCGVDVRDGIGLRGTRISRDDFVRALSPIPSAISVHRVVPAGHRGDPTDPHPREVVAERLHEPGATGGRFVTTVGERVKPHIVQSAALGQLRNRNRVLLMRVDAAGRHQPETVQASAARLGAIDGVTQRDVVEEAAVGDGSVDTRERLIDHAARADRKVSHLGVALLAARQPHGFAARCHQRVRPPPHQRVHLRCARLADGIADAVGAESPPVEHDEDERTEPAHRHALVNPGDLRRPARAPRPPSRSRRTRLRGDSRRRRARRPGPVVRRAPRRSPP